MSHAQDGNAREIEIHYSGKAAKSNRNEGIGSKQRRRTLLAIPLVFNTEFIHDTAYIFTAIRNMLFHPNTKVKTSFVS